MTGPGDTLPPADAFAAALAGDLSAREELWRRWPWDPVAMAAFTALVSLEVEALERAGRLPSVDEAEVASVLDAVRRARHSSEALTDLPSSE